MDGLNLLFNYYIAISLICWGCPELANELSKQVLYGQTAIYWFVPTTAWITVSMRWRLCNCYPILQPCIFNTIYWTVFSTQNRCKTVILICLLKKLIIWLKVQTHLSEISIPNYLQMQCCIIYVIFSAAIWHLYSTGRDGGQYNTENKSKNSSSWITLIMRAISRWSWWFIP